MMKDVWGIRVCTYPNRFDSHGEFAPLCESVCSPDFNELGTLSYQISLCLR